MNLEKFSENLRVLMARKKITQSQLAETSGLGASRINSYYHGEKEPSLSALVALILALDCSFEELTGVKLPTSDEIDESSYTDEERKIIRAYESADGKTRQLVELLLLKGLDNARG